MISPLLLVHDGDCNLFSSAANYATRKTFIGNPQHDLILSECVYTFRKEHYLFFRSLIE